MENKPSSTMTGISLTEHERRIVQAESERRGLYNFSATLRQIIREWAETYPQSESQFIHNLDVADCPPAE